MLRHNELDDSIAGLKAAHVGSNHGKIPLRRFSRRTFIWRVFNGNGPLCALSDARIRDLDVMVLLPWKMHEVNQAVNTVPCLHKPITKIRMLVEDVVSTTEVQTILMITVFELGLRAGDARFKDNLS
jgi:hypothetical protein